MKTDPLPTDKAGALIPVTARIPTELTQGKKRVTVTLRVPRQSAVSVGATTVQNTDKLQTPRLIDLKMMPGG